MPQSFLSAATVDGQLNLLKSGAFSDFKIICKNHEFKIHRAIVCPTSAYFSKICADGFGFKEGSEATVHLNGDDPAIVSRVLLFQYTRAYNAGEVPQIGITKAQRDTTMTPTSLSLCEQELIPGAEHGSNEKSYGTAAGLQLTMEQAKQYLSVHALVYVCADRLGIEELKEYACTNFVDIAGDEKMVLYLMSFYGELLTFVYENTMMERAQVLKSSTDLRVETATVASAIEDVIKEHEPMAWEIAQILKKNKADLEGKVHQLECKLRHANTRNDRIEEQLSIANERIQRKGPEQVAYAKKIVEKLQSYLGSSKKCTGCKKELKAGTITVEGVSSLAATVSEEHKHDEEAKSYASVECLEADGKWERYQD